MTKKVIAMEVSEKVLHDTIKTTFSLVLTKFSFNGTANTFIIRNGKKRPNRKEAKKASESPNGNRFPICWPWV
jgi:hypothetical protein